jgi:hypothetical protein
MSDPYELRVNEASYTSMNAFTRLGRSSRKNRFVIVKFSASRPARDRWDRAAIAKIQPFSPIRIKVASGMGAKRH